MSFKTVAGRLGRLLAVGRRRQRRSRRRRSSAPTPFAPMSPSSPTICSRAATPAAAATTSPRATSPTQFEALGLRPGDGGRQLAAADRVPPLSPAAAPRRSSVGGRTLHPGRARSACGRARTAALALEAPAGLRRLRARHAGARLRRLSRARRARQDRGRAEPAIRDGIAERRRRPSESAKRRMAALRGAVGMITIRTRASAATTLGRGRRGGGRPGTTWIEPRRRALQRGAGPALHRHRRPRRRAEPCSRRRGGRSRGLDEAAGAAAGRAASRSAPRGARRAGAATATRFASANVLRCCPAPIRRWPANMCC